MEGAKEEGAGHGGDCGEGVRGGDASRIEDLAWGDCVLLDKVLAVSRMRPDETHRRIGGCERTFVSVLLREFTAKPVS